MSTSPAKAHDKNRGITVEPYTESLSSAVRAFNQRISDVSHYQLRERVESSWLKPDEPILPREENFVAIDGDEVRGGYILKREAFLVRGLPLVVGSWYGQLSEVLRERKYGLVGVELARSAAAQSPLLMDTSLDENLLRLVKALRWKTSPVPLLFKVHRPARFVRRFHSIRSRPGMSTVLDVAAFSGAAWVAGKAATAYAGRRALAGSDCQAEVIEQFGARADEIWQSSKDAYEMVGVRDSKTLNRVHPSHGPAFTRLLVSRDGRPVGWCVLLEKQHQDHPRYGDLNVGIVVDAMARPEHAQHVLAAADDYLRNQGVDVTVTNHSHEDWLSAAARQGFWRSNVSMSYGVSPELAELLDPFDELAQRVHLTRADGEGEFYVPGGVASSEQHDKASAAVV